MTQNFTQIAIEKLNAATTGDYGRDCDAGREIANDVLAAMQSMQLPSVLGWLVQSVVAQGRYEGIHIGFFNRISEHAMA